ncbi:MAG: hypothetical protein J6K58_15265 [Lachnospiraceae bacterium]|nr:hypothetical protein [Lachnospiraceae bacterium]
MARYIIEEQLNKPADFVDYIIRDFADRYGMKVVERKGERYLECKDYIIGGVMRFKHTYYNGFIHIEAWLKGSFGMEVGLDGFWGWGIKAMYKSRIDELMAALRQPLPSDGMLYQNPQMSNMAMGNTGQPIAVRGTGNPAHATTALIFSGFAVAIGFCIPIIAIILAGSGVYYAKSAMGTAEDKKAQLAYRLSIWAIVIVGVMFIINLLLIVM